MSIRPVISPTRYFLIDRLRVEFAVACKSRNEAVAFLSYVERERHPVKEWEQAVTERRAALRAAETAMRKTRTALADAERALWASVSVSERRAS
jgi:hypothetical protein